MVGQVKGRVRSVRALLVLGVTCAVTLVSCGGDSLSLTEYSEEVGALITSVDSRLDAHADELASAAPDLTAAQAYFDDRVDGYTELVDGVEALNPPPEASWIHGELQRILVTLLEAEQDRAAAAASLVSADELDQAWEGPEAQVIRAAELEAIEICYAAQTQIDETQDRESLEDVAWIPSQMKEVVLVSFGCPE